MYLDQEKKMCCFAVVSKKKNCAVKGDCMEFDSSVLQVMPERYFMKDLSNIRP